MSKESFRLCLSLFRCVGFTTKFIHFRDIYVLMTTAFTNSMMTLGLEKTLEWMKALYMPWVEIAYTTRMPFAHYRYQKSFGGEHTFPFVRQLSKGELLVYSSALEAFTTWDPARLYVSPKERERGRKRLMTSNAFRVASGHVERPTSSPLTSQTKHPRSSVPGSSAERFGPKFLHSSAKHNYTPISTTSVTSTPAPPLTQASTSSLRTVLPPSGSKAASQDPLYSLVSRGKGRATQPEAAVLQDLFNKARRFKPR